MKTNSRKPSAAKPVQKSTTEPQTSEPLAPTREELIRDIKRVQRDFPDLTVTRNFYREHGKFSEGAWQRHFSRFSDFRKVAGLEEHPARAAKPVPAPKAPPEAPKPPKMPPKQSEPEEVDEIIGDKRKISLKTYKRITTLKDLIEYCEIDEDLWEIERWVCNKWEVGAVPRATRELPTQESFETTQEDGEVVSEERLVDSGWHRPHHLDTPSAEPLDKETGWNGGLLRVYPLFQVKATLVKRKNVEEANRIIERLRIKAESHAPEYPNIIIPQSNSGNVVEISPVDVHFGAQIWGRETGGDDYDLKIAERDYKSAVGTLIGRTDSYRPEKALLVFGHDQQNADNRAGSTENLTPQNNDGRYQKVADISQDCTIWAIDTCLLHYGQVEIIMVPGNHDPLSTWHLGRVLSAWYRNVPQVKIDNTPDMRKYWEYGTNMLLLTHGNKGKLENYDKTMAAQRPKMWGRTKWREAHTGDKHHRRTIELPGATVRILPSLRPECSWSAENHYKSIRAAEAYVWNSNEGMVGQATYSILQKDDE